MIALGFVTAACMMFITRHVWRAADELAARGGGGGPGGEVDPVDLQGPGGDVDPMDLPGDGMSPLDLFLTELLSPVAAVDH
jgi:hypothetical protein